jgi:mevalonate kinase
MFNPTVKVSAPGKVILFGEHAVVYGKTAIAVSLTDLRVNMEMTLLKEYILIFNEKEYTIPTMEDTEDKTLDMLKHVYSTEPSLIAVMFIFLKLIKGHHGVSIRVSTNIPIGSGLGSSSSFSVCLVTSMLLLTKQITSVDHLDLINKYAYELECIFHGTPSGIDNSIATFGGALSFTKSIGPPMGFKVLITDTKIPKDTKKMVSGVRVRFEQNPVEMNSCFDQIQSISEQCIKRFAENANHGFEELFDQNQSLLNQIGVGHDVIDGIVKCTKEFGFSTKLTGGGGGGCCITLGGSKELKKILEEKGFKCYMTDIGGSGVKIEE